jgi:hypothetical protein
MIEQSRNTSAEKLHRIDFPVECSKALCNGDADVIDCLNCAGTGFCPVCHGNGLALVEQDAEVCTTCQGFGRTGMAWCQGCGGSGRHLMERLIGCAECIGDGNCIMCAGEGNVYE